MPQPDIDAFNNYLKAKPEVKTALYASIGYMIAGVAREAPSCTLDDADIAKLVADRYCAKPVARAQWHAARSEDEDEGENE